MGQSSFDAPLPSGRGPENTESQPRIRLMEALLLIAPLPLFTAHLAGLWDKDSYRFFPLVLFALGYLVVRRIAKYGISPDEHRTRFAGYVVVFGLIFTVTSVLVASTWLAAVAMMLMIGGVSSRVAGASFRKHVLPLWWLLWLLLPPPFGFDRLFIQWYDEGVRQVAEAILDCAGDVHWLAGNILRTSERQFLLHFEFARFVTPYAAMAFAAIVAVWRRRSFLQTLALMASAAWWLFVSEVVGILAIPVLYRLWGLDLTSSGLSFAANGAIIGLAVLLIQSTDILLQPLALTAAALKSAVSQGWQAATRRFRRKTKRTQSARAGRRTEGSAATQVKGGASRRRVSNPIVARVVGVACAALACVQIALLVRPLSTSAGPAAEGLADIGKLLPREIGTWTRNTSSSKNGSLVPSRHDPWRFVSSDSTIEMSLASQSGEIEDVAADCCRDGWNLYRRVDWLTRSLRREVRVPQTEVDVVNSSGEAAWIVAGAVDSRGVPRTELSAAIRASWRKTPTAALLRRLGSSSAEAAPLLRLQFFVKSDEPLSPRQRESVRDAYRELLETVRQQRSKG